MKVVLYAAVLAMAALSVAACGGGAESNASADELMADAVAGNLLERAAPPPAEVVRQWPTKWCQAKPGIAKEELFRIMGTPTRQFPDQASWSAYNWSFTAFFDGDGRAWQLDINDIALSSAEVAQLGCETIREVS